MSTDNGIDMPEKAPEQVPDTEQQDSVKEKAKKKKDPDMEEPEISEKKKAKLDSNPDIEDPRLYSPLQAPNKPAKKLRASDDDDDDEDTGETEPTRSEETTEQS